ncbi:MAG: hypothetical protein XD95_0453 [Microgenomates bacterium 39_7]|nr:MAG: hypothetical protein XD95_0453 [Microgenomates bacterium 39_7]
MPTSTPIINALIVEPNADLKYPYQFLSKKYQLTRVKTVKEAIKTLSSYSFELFIISASFSPEKQVLLLDAFKNCFKDQVIPLVIIVDLSVPLSAIVGTKWSDKVCILSATASRKLTLLTVESLLSV